MLARFMRGKRAKATSSRAIERKTPSTIRACARRSRAGSAISRFCRAARRSRGIARSSSRAYTLASRLDSESGVQASEFKTASASQYSTASRSRERWRMKWSFYPSAAENQIAVVENRALSGRDGALRLVEVYLDTRNIRRRIECRGRGLVLVPDLHPGARWRGKPRPRDPVDFLRAETRAEQLVVRANGDALGSCVGRNDVERLAGGDTQPAPLPYGEVMDASVFAERAAVARDDFTALAYRLDALGLKVRIQKRRVIAVGHEADLEAFCLFGYGEAHLTRYRANLALTHFAQRKQGAR